MQHHKKIHVVVTPVWLLPLPWPRVDPCSSFDDPNTTPGGYPLSPEEAVKFMLDHPMMETEQCLSLGARRRYRWNPEEGGIETFSLSREDWVRSQGMGRSPHRVCYSKPNPESSDHSSDAISYLTATHARWK